MNRRLIRPNLSEIKEKMTQEKERSKESAQKKAHPPIDTHAENYYYLKQMSKKTPMAVVLLNGEIIKGYVEWYDRSCIKLTRDKAPNLLIYKHSIQYIYKLHDQAESSENKEKKR